MANLKVSEESAASALSGTELVRIVQGGNSLRTTTSAFATLAGATGSSVVPNAQTGTSYTVLTGDRSKLVTHTNGSAIAVTLPQAGVSFPSGWFYYTENRGAGTVTITPTTSTIDGAVSLTLATDQGILIASDGTNYFTVRGRGVAAGVYQPLDSDLTTIAGLTATTDSFMQSKSSAWAARTPTQVTADLIAVVGDSGSGGTKGLVPAPASGDAAAGKFLKADGTFAVPLAGGGGSSADAITGQPGIGGAIIPGLQGSPDIRVAGGNDDEFDTTDTSDPMTGWTTLGTPTSHSMNSFAKSHYYVKAAGTGGAIAATGIYKACPSIPFTVTAKLTDARLNADVIYSGLIIAAASPGKIEGIVATHDSSLGGGAAPFIHVQVAALTNPTTFGSVVSSAQSNGTVPLYLRIVVTLSTSVAYQYSRGGLIWTTITSARNPGFTVGAAGIMVLSSHGSEAAEALFDWIRFT